MSKLASLVRPSSYSSLEPHLLMNRTVLPSGARALAALLALLSCLAAGAIEDSAPPPASAGGTAAEEAGQILPSLEDVLQGVAADLVAACSDDGEGRMLVLAGTDSSLLAGYVSAVLPRYLAGLEQPAARVLVGETGLSGEGGELPPRFHPEVLGDLGGADDRFAVLVDARLRDGDGLLAAAVYSLRSGDKAGEVRVPFRLSEQMSLSLSAPAGELDHIQQDWFRLLGRIFRPGGVAQEGLGARLRLTEGLYFFERGLWADAALRLLEVAEPSPNSIFMQAVLALQLAGEGEKAAEVLQSVIKSHSGSGPLYALNVLLLLQQGSFEDAVILLDHARLLDLSREGFYRYARGLIAEQQGDEDTAKENYVEAAQMLQLEPFVQLKLAALYWGKYDLKNAVEFYRRAIEAGGGSTAVWSELGLALDVSGDTDGAIEAFRQALELDPRSARVAWHLSSLLKRRGRYEDALEVLQRVSCAEPIRPALLVSYGEAAAEMWRIAEAEQALQRALALAPDSVSAKVRLAELSLLRRHYEEARASLQELLVSNPEFQPARVAMAKLLVADGRVDDAVEMLSGAARGSRDEAPVRLALCMAHLQAGRYKEAEKQAQIALQAQKSVTAYSLLTMAFVASGELENARTAARSGLELSSRSALSHIALARVLEAEGRDEEALQRCREALDLNPYSYEALKFTGWLHRKMGQWSDCADVWQKALGLNQWDAELHWQLAEVLRKDLKRRGRALSHYEAHVQLGGMRAREAAEWVEKLR